MSFSVKLEGYAKNGGATLVDVEPSWWNARELVRDKRFVESQRRGSYCNYRAELSTDEVRELYERYLENVTSVKRLLCFKFQRLSPSCRKLHDALFRRAENFSHFRVNVVEWETGL